MLNIPEELKKNTPKAVILDTDAYNEIDDQYTIAYAMLSPESDCWQSPPRLSSIPDRSPLRTGWRKAMRKSNTSWGW